MLSLSSQSSYPSHQSPLVKKIPSEIFLVIFSYLPREHILTPASLLSRQHREIATCNVLWIFILERLYSVPRGSLMRCGEDDAGIEDDEGEDIGTPRFHFDLSDVAFRWHLDHRRTACLMRDADASGIHGIIHGLGCTLRGSSLVPSVRRASSSCSLPASSFVSGVGWCSPDDRQMRVCLLDGAAGVLSVWALRPKEERDEEEGVRNRQRHKRRSIFSSKPAAELRRLDAKRPRRQSSSGSGIALWMKRRRGRLTVDGGDVCRSLEYKWMNEQQDGLSTRVAGAGIGIDSMAKVCKVGPSQIAVSFGLEKRVKLLTWNLEEEAFQLERIFKGHTAGVSSLVHLKNSRYIASASLDKTIRLWSLDDPDPASDRVVSSPIGSPIAPDEMEFIFRSNGVLQGHNAPISTLHAIGSDLLASVGYDDHIRIWDVEEMECSSRVFSHRVSHIAASTARCESEDEGEDPHDEPVLWVGGYQYLRLYDIRAEKWGGLQYSLPGMCCRVTPLNERIVVAISRSHVHAFDLRKEEPLSILSYEEPVLRKRRFPLMDSSAIISTSCRVTVGGFCMGATAQTSGCLSLWRVSPRGRFQWRRILSAGVSKVQWLSNEVLLTFGKVVRLFDFSVSSLQPREKQRREWKPFQASNEWRSYF